MKIKNLRIKQLLKVAKLMNRYPAMSDAQGCRPYIEGSDQQRAYLDVVEL